MSNWKEFIYNTDFSKPNLAEIQAQLNQATQGCNVYPPQEQIFSAFDKTPLDQVRVVILGQDPYHEANQANGLAFSVNVGTKMPPSLRNIFKELKDGLGGELRTNTDLSDWAGYRHRVVKNIKMWVAGITCVGLYAMIVVPILMMLF